MTKIFIKDLVVGQQVESVFALQKKALRKTKSGEPFLLVTLVDTTGSIGGTMWWSPGIEEQWDLLSTNTLVAITAQVELYREQRQLKILSIETFNGEYKKSDFIASVDNREELLHELANVRKSISTPHLRTLIHRYLDDPVFLENFSTAPAAKSWHDNKVGGLLNHTLKMVKIIDHIVQQYHYIPIYRDLLIAGALLHDCGKIEEYDVSSVVIDKTDEGLLIGHTNSALVHVGKNIDAIPHFPKEDRDHLLHLIISHHGHTEYGASVVPSTLEAVILHCADLMESMITGISQLQKEHGESENPWVYSPILERWMHIRPSTLYNKSTSSCRQGDATCEEIHEDNENDGGKTVLF